MRRGALLSILGLGLAVVLACETQDGSTGPVGPSAIHPQPQPNGGRGFAFVSPCSATRCGDAPGSLERPRCAPQQEGCTWREDESVSFRQCPESDCGPAPGAEVCPAGTSFKSNTCGAENQGACVWHTSCAPPRSTTPCRDPQGCGDGVPAIAVLCSDGGTGGLECMQFATRCSFQASCE